MPSGFKNNKNTKGQNIKVLLFFLKESEREGKRIFV